MHCLETNFLSYFSISVFPLFVGQFVHDNTQLWASWVTKSA